ncbi:MAG TPA: dienelactone hydrolase family protein [Oscillatoriaceae cyanobacterium]
MAQQKATDSVASERARAVNVQAGDVRLDGRLAVPPRARGLVILIHGAGMTREAPSFRATAQALFRTGFATLLLDLLTPEETAQDAWSEHLSFDVGFRAKRLEGAARWALANPETQALRIGCLGMGTGGAVALLVAAAQPEVVHAVVSLGGRPDLAGTALARVKAPTLFVIGSLDLPVIALNEEAFRLLTAPKELKLVQEANHLFEAPGTLEAADRLACDWFERYLALGGGGMA